MVDHVSARNHTIFICFCPFQNSWMVETLSRCGFATSAAVLGIVSNLLTVFVLQQVRAKSSTEKLLLVLSLADLFLPLTHVTREIYLSLDKRVGEFAFFRISLFYLWHVCSVISILLTLLMAVRRYIAIAYPHLYGSVCNWQHTRKVIWAVCMFAAALFVPILFHNANPQEHDPKAHNSHPCIIDTTREIFYVSVIIATLRLNNTSLLTISYWFYMFVFLLLCPFVLALLSIKFTFALNKKVTSTSVLNPKLARANAKTKLILIVALLSLVRDLPLGLLTLSYVFFEPLPACLTIMRLLTKELTIILSATNLVVLYFTNEKFKRALFGSILSCRNRSGGNMEGAMLKTKDGALVTNSSV